MKTVKEEKAFKKDMKRIKKRNMNMKKFSSIIFALLNNHDLPHSARPHKLKGEYEGLWELHIEPDWLLIYDYDDDYLYLARTGSHSDLFK